MIEENREVHNGKTLFEVVSRRGNISERKFASAQAAAEYAKECFPDQEQDEDRTGKGWDIQVVGAER